MILYDTPAVDAFWNEASKALDLDPNAQRHALPFVEHFEGETPEMLQIIDDIADMAVRGLKRGTCHLAMQFEHDNVPMRQVGDYWIVVKTDGTPVCVTQIIAIEILPFNRVGPVFAASEGPEDGGIPTHTHWFALHDEYFREQCDRWGVAYRDDLPVVCESFITLYSPTMPWGKGTQRKSES